MCDTTVEYNSTPQVVMLSNVQEAVPKTSLQKIASIGALVDE